VDAILNFFSIPPPNDLGTISAPSSTATARAANAAPGGSEGPGGEDITNLAVRAADGSEDLTNSLSTACKGPATAADAWKNHKRMMIAAVKQRAIHKQQTQSTRIAMLSGSLCGGGGGGGVGGWGSIDSGGSGVNQGASGGEGGLEYYKSAEPSPAAMAQDFCHVPRHVVALGTSERQREGPTNPLGAKASRTHTLGTSERQRRWLDLAPEPHPPPPPPSTTPRGWPACPPHGQHVHRGGPSSPAVGNGRLVKALSPACTGGSQRQDAAETSAYGSWGGGGGERDYLDPNTL
jgi:hypothetical protein